MTAGHALSARFNTKMASAAVACQAEGTTIIPLVFESLSGWDERAIKELRKLTTALAGHSGEDEGDTWRRLISRVSTLFMKRNTALLSGRIPISPNATRPGGGHSLKADIVPPQCSLNVVAIFSCFCTDCQLCSPHCALSLPLFQKK